MTPEELTKLLRDLLKDHTEIYRHLIGLIKAILTRKQ